MGVSSETIRQTIAKVMYTRYNTCMAFNKKEYMKEYRRKNRERIADQKKEYDKRYYQENRKKVDAQNKQWAESNPDKHRAIHERKRNKRRFNGLRNEVLLRDNYQCIVCRNENSPNNIVHHIDETTNRGGRNANNSMENLITLCRSCHRTLHNGSSAIEDIVRTYVKA